MGLTIIHGHHYVDAHSVSLIKNNFCMTPGRIWQRDDGNAEEIVVKLCQKRIWETRNSQKHIFKNVEKCCRLLQCCKIWQEYCKQARRY